MNISPHLCYFQRISIIIVGLHIIYSQQAEQEIVMCDFCLIICTYYIIICTYYMIIFYNNNKTWEFLKDFHDSGWYLVCDLLGLTDAKWLNPPNLDIFTQLVN